MSTDSSALHSRRSVLRLGFFSALGLSVVGLTPVIRTSQQKVLASVLEPLFGVSASIPAAVDAIEEYLALLPQRQRWQIQGLFRAVEWGPLLSHGCRFTRLEPVERGDWLATLSRSSSVLNRQIFTALKQLGAMGIYQLDANWKNLGYPGPLLDR